MGGEAVIIAMTAWRIVPREGYTSETAWTLFNRKIPAAIHPNDDRQIHALLPSGTRPGAWLDVEGLLHAEPMDPAELCDTMREVWQRSR
jgi:hypothetical protein